MKNITKNLLLGLTGVCAVAIVWFLVELIIINRDAGPRDDGSLVAARTPDAGETNPDDDGDPDASDDLGVGDIVEPTIRPEPRGMHYELFIDPDSNAVLNVYAMEELFEYVENNWDSSFVYRGGGNAALTIGLVAVTGQDLATAAEHFLNEFLGENIAEFMGTQRMLDSELIGAVNVRAQQGGVTYEAWLYRLQGSEFALSFLINYGFDDQREALYEVISSMSISNEPMPQDGTQNQDGDLGQDGNQDLDGGQDQGGGQENNNTEGSNGT